MYSHLAEHIEFTRDWVDLNLSGYKTSDNAGSLSFESRDISPRLDFETIDIVSYNISTNDLKNIMLLEALQKRLFADTPGDTSTSATLAAGESYSDTLEVAGDEDWIRVTLVEGQRYNIALNGSGDNPLSDPLVRLLDEDGNQIATNDDAGSSLNSLLSYTAASSGTYYISAEAYSTETGDYTVTLTEVDPIEERSIDGIAHFLTDEFSSRTTYAVTTITYFVDNLVAGAQELAIRALAAWADLTPLNFEVSSSEDADIVFRNDDDGAYNENMTSQGNIVSSVINISSDWEGGNVNFDSYTYQTFLHEIGHALGLGHAGFYNGEATYGIDNAYLNDSWAYTIMSYFNQRDSNYFGDFRYVLGPQIADIIAIQDLYGANTTTRNGDTIYGFNSTEDITDVHNFDQFTRVPSLSIYDTGGIDTFDFSGYAENQTINLNMEAFSDVNGLRGVISISRGSIIENAIGGPGDDTLTGNEVDNDLIGGGGHDTLNGGDGHDTLIGGAQNDVLNGGAGNDVLLGGLGVDTLYGGTGSDLVLGGNRNDTLFGENGNDRTFGGNGDDQIDGGTGNDIMRGGTGVDTLNGGEGDDTIFGGTGIDQLFGDAGNDILFGRGGFDVLTGGAGDDILTGGFNADRFIFSDGFGNDTITDFAATSNAEKIDLAGVSEITDFADLLANHLSQSGTDAIIDDGLGNTITLAGVDINDLDAVDFVF